MLIHALAADIHQNAVEHGWWDGDRNIYEIIALIHSEWSEALEEARADRPMVWYQPDVEGACWRGCHAYVHFGACHGQFSAAEHPTNGGCRLYRKPEGIAVELVDGVIRILDFLGYLHAELQDPDTGLPATMESLWERVETLDHTPEELPTAVAFLHKFTAEAIPDEEEKEFDPSPLIAAMNLAMTWVHLQGIDPLALLLEKHEYNKGRPYKHGKRF